MTTDILLPEGSRLTVLAEAGADDHGRRLVRVRCACGEEFVAKLYRVTGGYTLSCGCLRIDRLRAAKTVHGHCAKGSASVEYEAWRTMIARCEEPATHSYPYFGAKGIRVCQEWRGSFEAFLAVVGTRPSAQHVLSRRDKSKDFTPENTEWKTVRDMGRSRVNNQFHTVGGETMCLEDWATRSGIAKTTLHYRLSKGLTMAEAIDVGHGRKGRALVA